MRSTRLLAATCLLPALLSSAAFAQMAGGTDYTVTITNLTEGLPDDGNVIAEHQGIQGVGELTDAHKWSGPVATITIEPKG